MDLAQAANEPKLLEIDGQSYKVGRFSIRDIGHIEGFLKERIPSPMDLIRNQLDGLPEGERKYLLNEARKDMANWPPEVGSLEANRYLLGTVAGNVLLMKLALQKHNPDMTDEDVKDIHTRMFAVSHKEGMHKLAKFFAIAFHAEDLPEDEIDPKDEA